MTPLRPSTEARIQTAGSVLARVIVGLVLFAFGVGFDFLEYREPPPTHTTHLAGFTLIALIGVLVAAGKFVFPVIQQFIVIVGPYIPVIGGRRAGDPPSPPSGGAS